MKVETPYILWEKSDRYLNLSDFNVFFHNNFACTWASSYYQKVHCLFNYANTSTKQFFIHGFSYEKERWLDYLSDDLRIILKRELG